VCLSACSIYVLAFSRAIQQLVFPLNIIYINGLNQYERNNIENLILGHVHQFEPRDIIQNSQMKPFG
jgi:hypothetical protein